MTPQPVPGLQRHSPLARRTSRHVVAAAAQGGVGPGRARQTDFAERAPALATDVVAARPAVVGLQEATVWECLDASGSAVDVFDFTTQFLDALGADGADYVIAGAGGAEAVSPGFAIAPIPGATGRRRFKGDPAKAVGSPSAACGFQGWAATCWWCGPTWPATSSPWHQTSTPRRSRSCPGS